MANVESQLDLHRQTNLQSTDSQGLFTSPDTKGVTVAWLSEAFEMPEAAVRHRLQKCPVKFTRIRGERMRVKLYDLKTAAKYLVSPAFSTREYMKLVKRGDLPPQLQEAVWNVLLKRQKWEENAGSLWRTEAIREVLGDTFQTIKFTMQLWTETIERTTELSDAQRELIVNMVDGLQSEIYNALVQNMKDAKTGPQITDLETMFGESESISDIIADEEASVVEQLV